MCAGIDFTNSNKTVYDYVLFDSEGEREFAEHLINDSRVKVFTKLPRGFFVDTPFGKYLPDWAIVFIKNDEEKLYLVRETKFYGGKKLEDFLSKEELNKIECAKKHFKAINTSFDGNERIHHRQMYALAESSRINAMGAANEILNTPNFEDWISFLKNNYFRVLKDQGFYEQIGVNTPDVYNKIMDRLTNHN